jgi:acyl carrier protein
MGLDYVELVLEVEKRFQIAIADEEAGDVRTAGDLYQLILGKLPAHDSSICLTSVAFYRTRRAMVEVLNVERKQVKPSTVLESLLPRQRRRRQWQELRASMALSLPNLEHAGWLQATFFAGSVAVSVLPVILGKVSYLWILPLVLLGFIGGFLLMLATPMLASEWPGSLTTVGDLAKDVLARNYALLASGVQGWNEQEVWESLCRIMVDQLGLRRQEITPEARIVDDLGVE